MSDNLSQATQAFFFNPNEGRIYPNLVAPTQLLSDAGMKWLSDANSSLHTPNAVNPKISLKGPGRGKWMNNPIAQRSTGSCRTCPPLAPERAAGR